MTQTPKPPRPRKPPAPPPTEPLLPAALEITRTRQGMPLRKALTVHFEISIDGKPRNYRDRKAVAIEAAKYLKWKPPHSEVLARDFGAGRDGGGVQVLIAAGADKPDVT